MLTLALLAARLPLISSWFGRIVCALLRLWRVVSEAIRTFFKAHVTSDQVRHIIEHFTDLAMKHSNDSDPSPLMNSAPTARQGQFLAYIHQYTVVNGCAPAEADMQRFFQIAAPSVHSMVLMLERRGFIRRVPGQARSITLIVAPESLPPLKRVQR